MEDIVSFRKKDRLSREARLGWLIQTKGRIVKQWWNKFIIGQRDHGSDIGTVPILQLLAELEAEHLDALSYIAEIKRRIINDNEQHAKKRGRRKAANGEPSGMSNRSMGHKGGVSRKQTQGKARQV